MIETCGHVPGHQSVIVSLPQTGLVLLAIDAVALQAHFTRERPVGPTDADGEQTIASTLKLFELNRKRLFSLTVFGHEQEQWNTPKQLPAFYD